jgi:hypothetical protein
MLAQPDLQRLLKVLHVEQNSTTSHSLQGQYLFLRKPSSVSMVIGDTDCQRGALPFGLPLPPDVGASQQTILERVLVQQHSTAQRTRGYPVYNTCI